MLLLLLPFTTFIVAAPFNGATFAGPSTQQETNMNIGVGDWTDGLSCASPTCPAEHSSATRQRARPRGTPSALDAFGAMPPPSSDIWFVRQSQRENHGSRRLLRSTVRRQRDARGSSGSDLPLRHTSHPAQYQIPALFPLIPSRPRPRKMIISPTPSSVW